MSVLQPIICPAVELLKTELPKFSGDVHVLTLALRGITYGFNPFLPPTLLIAHHTVSPFISSCWDMLGFKQISQFWSRSNPCRHREISIFRKTHRFA